VRPAALIVIVLAACSTPPAGPGRKTEVGSPERRGVSPGAGAKHCHIAVDIDRARERCRGRFCSSRCCRRRSSSRRCCARSGSRRCRRWSRSLRRWGRSRCSSGSRLRGFAFLEQQDDRACRDLVAHLHAQLFCHPGVRRRDLHRRLVRLQLEERLVRLHGVAVALEPARDRALAHGLPERRNADREAHRLARAGRGRRSAASTMSFSSV